MKKASLLTLAGVLLLFFGGAIGFLAREQSRLQKDVQRIEWQNEIRDYNRDRSEVSLRVGTIQFLKNGFTLAFDTVESTPTGVLLVGKFGNPKALNLSSLTLALEVDKPIWKFQDTFDKDPLGFEFAAEAGDSLVIGKAEVLVGDVPAGGTTPFRIVVPNVKGNPVSETALVKLLDERYTYLR